jgi:Zinc knuckle
MASSQRRAEQRESASEQRDVVSARVQTRSQRSREAGETSASRDDDVGELTQSREASESSQRDEIAQLDEDIRAIQRQIEIEDKKKLKAALQRRLRAVEQGREPSAEPDPVIHIRGDGDEDDDDDDDPAYSTPDYVSTRSGSSKRRRSRERGAHLAKRGRRPQLKVRTPDLYTGQSLQALTEFIRTCEDGFRNYPYDYEDDSEKLNYAVVWVGGSPRSAWDRHLDDVVEQGGSHDDLTWKFFCQFLKDQLQNPSTRGRTRFEKYTKATQRATQTVQEYATYLETLEEDFTKLAERQRVDHFISTLRPELRKVILDRPSTIATYSEAILVAAAVEENGRQPVRAGKKPAERSHDDPSQRDGKTPHKGKGKPFEKKNIPNKAGKGRGAGGATSRANNTPLGGISPQVREKRLKNNLCLSCGQEGHWAAQCPRSSGGSKNGSTQ